MEDEVTFSPEMREYWSSHSELIGNLFDEKNFVNYVEYNDDEWVSLPRSYFSALTDSQFRVFKAIVEGDQIFVFGPSGTVYLNTTYNIKPRELTQILDYIGYTKPHTMMKDLGDFAREYRIAQAGLPAGARQTDALRVRAGAARTRRLRQEARRAGMPVRNYMEFLQEEREERKKQRRKATMRAAKQFKKRGLGLSLNSSKYRHRTAKQKKAKWGEKRGFGPRRRNPSHREQNSNKVAENSNEEEVGIENAEEKSNDN